MDVPDRLTAFEIEVAKASKKDLEEEVGAIL